MSETSEPAGRQKLLAYLLYFGLYILLLALALALLAIWRSAILAVIEITMHPQSFARRPIYLLLMMLIGLGLFVLAMVAEPYLRTGVPRRELMRRFARLAVPMGIACVLGLLIIALAGTFG